MHVQRLVYKCVLGSCGYSEGIVRPSLGGVALWEACENAVKMSLCGWHRTGLMEYLGSQRCLYVCVLRSLLG